MDGAVSNWIKVNFQHVDLKCRFKTMIKFDK